MSSSYTPLPTFQTTLRTFAQDPDLPFAELLTESHNAPNKKAAYENILWALINTKEFYFHH